MLGTGNFLKYHSPLHTKKQVNFLIVIKTLVLIQTTNIFEMVRLMNTSHLILVQLRKINFETLSRKTEWWRNLNYSIHCGKNIIKGFNDWRWIPETVSCIRYSWWVLSTLLFIEVTLFITNTLNFRFSTAIKKSIFTVNLGVKTLRVS